MRLGIADHLGWAIAVTASGNHEVVDRRRIELIEPGMSAAPIHYESRRLDVAATAALVAKARASVVRAASVALDEIATALPAPVLSISLRAWPLDFPDDIAVQRRAPCEARADAIMYRQELSELADARDWEIHPYDAKAVVGQAVRMLAERAVAGCVCCRAGVRGAGTTSMPGASVRAVAVHLVTLGRVDAGVERDDDPLLLAVIWHRLVREPGRKQQQSPGHRFDVQVRRL